MSDETAMQVHYDGWNYELLEDTMGEDPPTVFHYLDKLPREIGDMIWTEVIKEDVKSDLLTYLAVRESSRALACESMLAFSEHALFSNNPEKDDRWQMGDVIFSPSFTAQIKNLEIDLAKFREHRFFQSTYPSERCYELMYLEDHLNVLGTLALQGDCKRHKCVLRADFDGAVFALRESLMWNLRCLQKFSIVIFEGFWDSPNDPDVLLFDPPEDPFDDFKAKLERLLGPAICRSEDPLLMRLEFYPLQYLEKMDHDQPEQPVSVQDEMMID